MTYELLMKMLPSTGDFDKRMIKFLQETNAFHSLSSKEINQFSELVNELAEKSFTNGQNNIKESQNS